MRTPTAQDTAGQLRGLATRLEDAAEASAGSVLADDVLRDLKELRWEADDLAGDIRTLADDLDPIEDTDKN